MRLIDADALLKELGMAEDCEKCPNVYKKIFCKLSGELIDVCITISDMPTIDPKEGGENDA